MSLRTVEYCVFDEADRLFEMGFAAQLKEILAKMNESRQARTPWSFLGGLRGGGPDQNNPIHARKGLWAVCFDTHMNRCQKTSCISYEHCILLLLPMA